MKNSKILTLMGLERIFEENFNNSTSKLVVKIFENSVTAYWFVTTVFEKAMINHTV
jgi:hypothetical protein